MPKTKICIADKMAKFSRSFFKKIVIKVFYTINPCYDKCTSKPLRNFRLNVYLSFIFRWSGFQPILYWKNTKRQQTILAHCLKLKLLYSEDNKHLLNKEWKQISQIFLDTKKKGTLTLSEHQKETITVSDNLIITEKYISAFINIIFEMDDVTGESFKLKLITYVILPKTKFSIADKMPICSRSLKEIVFACHLFLGDRDFNLF